MGKKWLIDAGRVLCAAGGAILIIRTALGSHPAFSKWLLTVAIVLCTLGLISYAVSAFAELGKPLREGFERVAFRSVESPHSRAFAKIGDLPALHIEYTKHFHDDVPSIDLMRSWIERCNTSFVLVYRETQEPGLSKHQELVGSFKFLPLTAEGIRAMQGGQATGSTFKPEHICAKRGRASAYYIGDVFAGDKTARAVVLHELKGDCLEVSSRSVSFYARPLTKDGRHVMIRRRFFQVSDGRSKPELGKLCRLDLPATG